ncbi:hypothetical protein K523DRAFT_324960 [Schizophyllum commune Tattone D]|nr:hypothetical protein K523DRAFT_324960 [Schizophyllum commune Tattone D]
MNVKVVERTKVVLDREPAPSQSASQARSTVGPSNSQSQSRAENAPTSDPLQIAAQIYPWLYMTSTLEKAFGDSERAAEAEIEAFARDLAQDEEEIRDEKVRWESERFVEFCDSLSSTPKGHLHVLQDLPEIIQSYLRHGKEADTWERKALDMAMSQIGTGPAAGNAREGENGTTEEDGQAEEERLEGAYQQQLTDLQDAIDRIEGLVEDAGALEGRIQGVIDAVAPPPPAVAPPSPPSSVKSLDDDTPTTADPTSHPLLTPLQQLLPLLSLRSDNLKLALELVDGAREGAAMNLRAISLGLY